tara:strand:+ start:3401 stop:5206 length:1806 start_codon:yes stop_codon:yes gene_type:complete
MATTDVKELAIDYTARNFSSIREELVTYAKRYYPDTFKDFNEASFGALMLDMVSYVGDILSFYTDYQANESFLQTALEYNNVIKLARQLGYKFNASPTAHGILQFYILVPVASVGGGPDTNYLPILKRGTTLNSTNGASYILVEDINFANSSNEVVVGAVNDVTGAPTSYAIKASGAVISGQFAILDFEIGEFEKFRKIEIPGGQIVSEIVSVTDSNGNEYTEVDYLSQDVVYSTIVNPDADQRIMTPSIIKPVAVPRRFVLEREAQNTFIIFGHGSESDLRTDPVAEPNKVILDLHGKDYVTDKSFDPNNLISSDKLGVGPANTTLTVVFRTNRSNTVNSPVGAVTRVGTSNFRFNSAFSLNGSSMNSVINSLQVNNETPILGDPINASTDEIRQKAYGSFFSQNRAVTLQDYKNLVYSMPLRFGSISRCSMVKDSDSFKRNLNLYVLSKNNNGTLTNSNSTLKLNLKTWLNKYRMINDSVDILDARIINLGVTFDIIGRRGFNKATILNDCLQALGNLFAVAPDIGEFLEITTIYKTLNLVEGVADTVNVEVNQKLGSLYSDTFFDIESAYSADRRFIRFPIDTIYEFKYSTDFEGTIR